jgi:tripartite-type tricarboxylate transporter receptor subunit TctC
LKIDPGHRRGRSAAEWNLLSREAMKSEILKIQRYTRLFSTVALGAALVTAAMPGPAAAEDNFYAGKTLRMLIGFSSGGGFDIYARTVARHLGEHIPGHPQIVPENMPGAGSMKVVNYLYNIAPKDGTVIGHFAPGVMTEPLLGHGEGVQFDATKFGWLGSVSQEVSVCAYMTSAGIASWQDMENKISVVGASGGGAESDVFPTLLRNMFQLPLRIVTGYPGGTEITLAMQRHEVDGHCGWSWTSLLSRNKAMLTNKEIDLTLQIALTKSDDPFLADVPLIMDMTKDPAERAALKLIVSRQSIARPFATPPGLPPERLAMLRDAFAATMKDPDFLAEAQTLGLDVHPVTGGDVETLIKEVYASSPEAIKIATQAMQSKQ